MNKYSLLFICILFCRCQKQQNNIDELFLEKLCLTSQLLEIKSSDILEPIHILTIDSLLICSNFRTDKIVRIYDMNSGDVLNDIISTGRSKFELLDVTSMWFADDELNIYGLNSRKILHIPSDQLLKENPQIRVTEVEQSWFKVAYDADMKLYYNSLGLSQATENRQFGVFDYNTKNLGAFGDYPLKDKGLHNNELLIINQGEIAVNSNKKRLFYFSNYGLRFKVFDISNPYNIVLLEESIISEPTYTTKSKPEKQQYSIKWADDSVRGALAMTSSPECYYVLCDGKKLVSDKNWMINTVYQFDWSGTPLKILELNRDVQTISYNEQNNQLVALSTDEGGRYIFVSYDL